MVIFIWPSVCYLRVNTVIFLWPSVCYLRANTVIIRMLI